MAQELRSMKRCDVIVVEDEALTREYICKLVKEDPELRFMGGCETVAETAEIMDAKTPDILLLDIQLPGEDGFSLLGALAGPLPVVVFITAHHHYAIQAFEVHAVDYLLKPFDKDRFQQAMQWAKRSVRTLESQELLTQIHSLLPELEEPDVDCSPLKRLVVKEGGRNVLLATSEIDWIEAKRDYVQIHRGLQTYLLRKSMKMLEQQLDPRIFVRIHRSYIVNLDFVEELHPLFHGDHIVVLKDKTRLRLSRHYKHNMGTRLGHHF